MTKDANDLQGISGWLILVALGLIITPIRIIFLIITTYSEIFSNDAWSVLTTPGSDVYHPLWGGFIITELVFNIGLLLASFYLLYLFFTKKSLFPKWYIGILIFNILFVVVDILAFKIIVPHEPAFDSDAVRDFIRAIVAAFIWIPYMLMSQRVKNTFINP